MTLYSEHEVSVNKHDQPGLHRLRYSSVKLGRIPSLTPQHCTHSCSSPLSPLIDARFHTTPNRPLRENRRNRTSRTLKRRPTHGCRYLFGPSLIEDAAPPRPIDAPRKTSLYHFPPASERRITGPPSAPSHIPLVEWTGQWHTTHMSIPR